MEKRSTGSDINYVEKTICKAHEEEAELHPHSLSKDHAGLETVADPVIDGKRSNLTSAVLIGDENSVRVDDADELQLQEELEELEHFGVSLACLMRNSNT